MEVNFVLIGGNRLREDGPLLSLAANLIDNGKIVNVVTEDLHLEMPTEDERPFADRLAELGISPVVLRAIKADNIGHLINDQTWGLALNAIWIIPPEVIDLFGGRLFNYHNARLPEERGAAAYTWKILRGQREARLTIQDLTPELDEGDVRMALEFEIPFGIQADIYERMRPLEELLLRNWAAECEEGGNFPRIVQNHAESGYFPRLNTMANGWIDWSWTAEEIVRFIMAFDDPHPGASTMLGESRIHLKSAKYSNAENDFHPFHSGLVYRQSSAEIHIAARGGSIIVADPGGIVRLGTRFHTPSTILDQAMTMRPAHSHNGIKIK